MKKIAVLISGSGTNLQAIIDKCLSGYIEAEIVCVLSNDPNAYGLERAKLNNIKTKIINSKDFETNVLFNEGLIESFEELSTGIRGSLLLSLKYSGVNRKPVIEKIERISKPGLRVYSGSKKMPRVLGGFGTAIISTSKGLMTDRQARSEGIGGEILCYIW